MHSDGRQGSEATQAARAMRRACISAIERQMVQRNDEAVQAAGRELASKLGIGWTGLEHDTYDAWEKVCKEAGGKTKRRQGDAIGIIAGACNPSGIVKTLVEACEEVDAEGTDPGGDPAVGLIMHQLAWIVDLRDPGSK